MDNTLKVVGGVSLGAGLLLLLDPPAGWRRGGNGLEDERFELKEMRWSPTARLLVGAAGGGLALYGAARRDRVGAALGSLGLGLLVRGLTDRPVRRLVGLARERGATEVQRAIHVDAPVDAVFGVWADYETYPRFLTRVREVGDLSDGRSRWVVEGPSGVPVEWIAVLTRFETGRQLAWRTVGDEHYARVLLTPDAEGGTRVEVRLSGVPAGGRDDVATLFGSGADRQIDEDLLRMKSYVERGGAAGNAEQP
jgi:uncharacterized membrane protein